MEMKNVANCFPISHTNCLVVIGPDIKNPLWLQMKADSLNKTLKVVKMDEAVSFGALKSAYSDFPTSSLYENYVPNKNRVSEMNKIFSEYLLLYNQKKLLTEKQTKTTS